jgi:Signal transduction histidine kinase regulating citrate/malate metabolism
MHAIPWYIALLISVPQAVFIIEFGFRLFNIRIRTRDIIGLAVIMGVICYLLRPLALPYAVNTLILITLLSILSSFLSRINLRYCFASIVLGMIIYGVLESVLLPLIMGTFHIPMEIIIINPWINLAAFVPIALIASLLLAFIVRKDFILYDFSSEAKLHNTWWAVAAILVQILFILLINSSIVASANLYSLKKALPYLNLGLVFICVFEVFTIKHVEKQVKEHTQTRLLKNHLHQVESILETSEIQRHEYVKHMQTILALIELNKFETAREYINGITSQYRSNKMIYYIDHPAISALINSKSSVAQFNNIDFAVAVKCELADIHIPVWDLCSMLGNLLDNAIEAAATAAEPRVGVEFKFDNGFYLIYIINNGSPITDPAQVFEAGITTKGSDTRGYGLYIVNKLVNKYHGSIEIIAKPKTTIILKLPGVGKCYAENSGLRYG